MQTFLEVLNEAKEEVLDEARAISIFAPDKVSGLDLPKGLIALREQNASSKEVWQWLNARPKAKEKIEAQIGKKITQQNIHRILATKLSTAKPVLVDNKGQKYGMQLKASGKIEDYVEKYDQAHKIPSVAERKAELKKKEEDEKKKVENKTEKSGWTKAEWDKWEADFEKKKGHKPTLIKSPFRK